MQRRNFIKIGAGGALAGILPITAFSRMLNTEAIPSFCEDTSDSNSIEKIIRSLSRHTTTVKCNGADVTVHAIQTGLCAVKESHITRHVPHFLTPLKITFDKHFTEFFPIWVWVIEHPEGVIVVDTGENAGVMNDDYFKPAGKIVAAYNKKNIKFQVTEEDELGSQLIRLNIVPDDVMCVVLTHLHLDHTDGLHHFPTTEIVVNKEEFNHPSGNIPQLYPAWFKPKLVSYKEDFISVFRNAYPITQKEDVLLIPTHGHTPNHASVLFKTDDFDILFAGDVSYSEQQLLNNDLPGIHTSYRKSLSTYRDIRTYAENNNLVYLPSHDADSAKRLIERIFL